MFFFVHRASKKCQGLARVPLCSASVKGAPVRRPQAASPSDRHSAPWRWGNNRPKPLCAFGLPKSMSRGSPDAAEGWGKLKVHTKTSLRSFLYGHFSFVFAFIHTKPFFSGFMYGQELLSKTKRALFCPKGPYKTCQRSVFVWIFV